MKVLQVINTLNMGGAEKLLVDIILELKKSIDIDVYVLDSKETSLKKTLEENGVKIFNCGTSSFKSMKHLKWMKKNAKNYDVIHSHLSYSQYYVAGAKFFNGSLKTITTEHSTNNNRRNSKLFRMLEKFVYGKYDYIATINESTKESVLSWQTNLGEKVVIVDNGVDLNRFRNSTGKVGDEILLRKDIKKILMVAAFREEKNHELIIDAMKELDENYHLILVGRGDRKDFIADYIKHNGLSERIHMLGMRQDIPEIMKNCDVFVIPSKWEGFGIVAVEAMAAGIPVIASNVVGLAQVVDNAGILFDNTSSSELAREIKKVLTNEVLVKQLIKAGSERCKDFDLDTTIKCYLDLYNNLLNI